MKTKPTATADNIAVSAQQHGAVTGAPLRTASVTRIAEKWRLAKCLAFSDAAFALGDQCLVSSSRFLATVLIGRFCGAGELGLYSVTVAVVFYVGIAQESLISLPYAVYVNQTIGEERRRYAGAVLCLQAALALTIGLSLTALNLWQPVFLPPDLAPLLFVLAAAVPCWTFHEFCRRTAFAHLEFRSALLLDAGLAVMHLSCLTVLAATSALSTVATLAVIAATCSLTTGIWFFIHRRAFTVGGSVRIATEKHWMLGRWCLLTQLLGLTSGYLPYWLLLGLCGITTAGKYTAASTIVLLANPMIMSVSNVITPHVSRRLAEDGADQMLRLVEKTIAVTSLATGLFAVVLGLLGGQIIVLVFGDAFSGMDATMSVLALAPVAWAISAVCYSGLAALQRSHIASLISAASSTLIFLGGILLIPAAGTLGAALSLLLGSLLSAGLHIWQLCKSAPLVAN